ncbi:MAG: DNA adenine methylase [Eubacteriales bacterium]
MPSTRQKQSTKQIKIHYKTTPSYKISQINNRRYLGNKYKLLPFITKIVEENCKNINSVADIFAGTGAVTSAFLDKEVLTNDIMYSNYLCHLAWFSPEVFRQDVLIERILYYNKLENCNNNYMSENFSDTFFSKDDCKKIGYIREDIQNLFEKNQINQRERALLLTALLYGMDKIANTCGHYDAYRKGSLYTKSLELFVPTPQENLNPKNQCFHRDANELVKEIKADLVYIDPPYNSRQYCDAYHLLENVARWEKPEVFGVARKMDRSQLKSAYCTRKAPEAFDDLVQHINARYILLSYNNMEQKGNDRSNARISDEEIQSSLEKKGKVSIFSERYKAFTTGKSDHQSNEERLFLCECYENPN